MCPVSHGRVAMGSKLELKTCALEKKITALGLSSPLAQYDISRGCWKKSFLSMDKRPKDMSRAGAGEFGERGLS